MNSNNFALIKINHYLLPEGFNPYTDVIAVTSINYMEDEEMDLGFDTSKYLPEGFDPYSGSIQ